MKKVGAGIVTPANSSVVPSELAGCLPPGAGGKFGKASGIDNYRWLHPPLLLPSTRQTILSLK